jgi:3-hydroxyisobutyrate dehydrogenase-like beta-hydroxyacid dehydrogenase
VSAIGIVHPGEMGAAVATVLCERGHDVAWASAGRGAATRERAARLGLRDCGSLDALAARSDVLLSICPPHAALELAALVGPFTGVYVDLNAISPQTARAVAERVVHAGARFVDGSIIGPPPRSAGDTRAYLCGPAAGAVAELLAGQAALEPVVLVGEVGTASALKMAYAAWTKGTAALLLCARALADAEGVDDALLREWERSQPALAERCQRAERSAAAKGWRWVGEMDEIAASLRAVDLPAGFHEAAAEVFAAYPRD